MQFIINFCETRIIKTSILTEWNTYNLWVHLYVPVSIILKKPANSGFILKHIFFFQGP